MYATTSLDKARNHPDMMQKTLQDQTSWNKEQPVGFGTHYSLRNISMVNLCEEEMFAAGLWWKEQYRANALTEVRAVVVRSVRVRHYESV